MQYIMRYQLKPKTAVEHQKWLAENGSAIRENAPEGWTYLGTWFTVRGFGHYEVEDRWELDGYDALGSDWGNETFQQLMREWMEFGDQTRDGETYLMKSAEEVRVFE
ncbi:MAG: hypothetical protein PVH11_04480 [Anaerolineae bacterium]